MHQGCKNIFKFFLEEKYFYEYDSLKKYVTVSAERLLHHKGVEELVPWIWSATNHHDISSFCLPEISRSRGGGTVSRDALWRGTSL